MKYTRYDLKKNNKKNNGIFFLILICVVLILAFVSGSMISNLFIKKSKQNPNTQQKSIKQNVENTKKGNTKDKSFRGIDNFIVVQCGVFANDNNANTLKEQLKNYGDAFVFKEDGKNKVILGVYSDGEISKVIKVLQDSKIEFSKINIRPDLNNKANLQIAQIINAQLQIVHRFCNDKVKSVNTEQIKDWCSKLEMVNESEKNYELLNQLKNNVKSLPQKITKDKLEELNKYLYKNIKKLQ